jgi:hypothetical protein
MYPLFCLALKIQAESERKHKIWIQNNRPGGLYKSFDKSVGAKEIPVATRVT